MLSIEVGKTLAEEIWRTGVKSIKIKTVVNISTFVHVYWARTNLLSSIGMQKAIAPVK
jgi:hypothetical protein